MFVASECLGHESTYISLSLSLMCLQFYTVHHEKSTSSYMFFFGRYLLTILTGPAVPHCAQQRHNEGTGKHILLCDWSGVAQPQRGDFAI